MAVLIAHAFDFYPGMFGVDVFFVISGFIMASIAKKPRQFISDRFWRIYPIYWLCAVPWLIVAAGSPAQIMATLTLWPVWGGQFILPLMPVAWTLCFEMLFYLAMTLGMLTRPIIPLVIFALSFALFGVTGNALFSFTGNPLVVEFLAGIAITRLPRRLGGLLLGLGTALWVISIAGHSYHPGEINSFGWSVLRTIFWGLPALLIVWGAVTLECKFQHQRLDPLVGLGDASYSLYLIHIAVVASLGILGPLVVLVLGTGAGLALHRFVEKPLSRLRHIRISGPVEHKSRL